MDLTALVKSVCDPHYIQYCRDHYGNSYCEQGCDSAPCGWDGSDCFNQHSPLWVNALRNLKTCCLRHSEVTPMGHCCTSKLTKDHVPGHPLLVFNLLLKQLTSFAHLCHWSIQHTPLYLKFSQSLQ
ncbi:hypothetical protein GJAV_G00009170 [Gymnothorax javanicus]|nr:hypothetical protein GJAV_G00009170 [Gymnothorax javanicus]